eukprot:scaffold33553_cov15-Tisochrysis_lutea.AAC.1
MSAGTSRFGGRRSTSCPQRKELELRDSRCKTGAHNAISLQHLDAHQRAGTAASGRPRVGLLSA